MQINSPRPYLCNSSKQITFKINKMYAGVASPTLLQP